MCAIFVTILDVAVITHPIVASMLHAFTIAALLLLPVRRMHTIMPLALTLTVIHYTDAMLGLKLQVIVHSALRKCGEMLRNNNGILRVGHDSVHAADRQCCSPSLRADV